MNHLYYGDNLDILRRYVADDYDGTSPDGVTASLKAYWKPLPAL